jgi:hypothetical protein
MRSRIALFLSIFLLITQAQADTSQSDAAPLAHPLSSVHSLYLLSELSGGASSLSAPSGPNADGSELSAVVLASWNISKWTLDGGFGVFENTVSGSSTTFTQYEMQTVSLLAKISPQYHLTENLQIGPTAEVLFGSDVGFEAGLANSGQNVSWLMGAQALYAVHSGAFPVKLGLRYLASLNLPKNSLRSVEATIQFGLPIL